MRSELGNPGLHSGGVHEAIMAEPPTFTDVTEPEVVPLALNAPASDVLHVKLGGVVSTVSEESVTVAVIVFDPPLVTENEVSLVPLTASEIDFTGQVIKSIG